MSYRCASKFLDDDYAIVTSNLGYKNLPPDKLHEEVMVIMEGPRPKLPEAKTPERF